MVKSKIQALIDSEINAIRNIPIDGVIEEAIDLIGKTISDFLILYNNKGERTTDYIRNLCQMIRVEPKTYFQTQPCLSWWSWEKHNDEGLVDRYIIKEWDKKKELNNKALAEKQGRAEEHMRESTAKAIAARKLSTERRNRLAAARLQAKKDECTSFGFEPKTPDHAECVMKMAIAEKARNKSESQAKTLAEQSAAEARAYQAEIRRVQAQQEAANREARDAAKRQREAQVLINLGGAISSGQFPLGNSSEPAFSDEPMPSFDSGRYKECFYRVAGDRLSVSIPRAQGCPATRNFGSRVGYLTRWE